MFPYFLILNHYYHVVPLCHSKNTILSQLDAGHSIHSITASIDVGIATISRLCSKKHSDFQRSAGDSPSKPSSINVCYAICLISSNKAENAAQITKALSTITNQPLHPNTVCHHLKKVSMCYANYYA